VISDDEHVYRFIAQTLRTGSLTAPSPGQDLAFFREQFVVLDERVRYGKYPIGHPLLLALGQALGLETLVVPVVTGAIALPLFWLARHLADRQVAILAVLFFGSSPQVLFTGATFLSQPVAAFCLVAGLALLRASARPGARVAWALGAAGALFGYGVLARPLPGLLFVIVAGAWLLLRRPRPSPAQWIAFS